MIYLKVPLLKVVVTAFMIISFTILNGCSGTGGSAVNTVANKPGSNTGVVTLGWMPPTSNNDNTDLSDLSGYRIYYGLSANSLTEVLIINNAGLSSYVVENLIANTTYFFTITAVNESGVESDYSNFVSKTSTTG